MTQDFLAHTHTEPDSALTRSHGLLDHLNAVASAAGHFAQGWGTDWAWIAGLWHDLGKFRPGFQQYIRLVNDAHIVGKLPASSDKTHSAAGALHALRLFEQTYGRTGALVARPIAYVIAGHHAGLADWTAGLDTRLLGTGAGASETEYAQALRACSGVAPGLLDLPVGFDLRAAWIRTGRGSKHRR